MSSATIWAWDMRENIALMNAEADRQEALSKPPDWLVTVASEWDAFDTRELGVDCVSVEDRALRTKLPSGPESCALLVGKAQMAAAAFRAAGVQSVYGLHLPPNQTFLAQFLRDRAEAAEHFLGRSDLRIVWDAYSALRAQAISVPPRRHRSLLANSAGGSNG